MLPKESTLIYSILSCRRWIIRHGAVRDLLRCSTYQMYRCAPQAAQVDNINVKPRGPYGNPIPIGLNFAQQPLMGYTKSAAQIIESAFHKGGTMSNWLSETAEENSDARSRGQMLRPSFYLGFLGRRWPYIAIPFVLISLAGDCGRGDLASSVPFGRKVDRPSAASFDGAGPGNRYERYPRPASGYRTTDDVARQPRRNCRQIPAVSRIAAVRRLPMNSLS